MQPNQPAGLTSGPTTQLDWNATHKPASPPRARPRPPYARPRLPRRTPRAPVLRSPSCSQRRATCLGRSASASPRDVRIPSHHCRACRGAAYLAGRFPGDVTGTFSAASRHDMNTGRLPAAFTGRQDRRSLRLRPVEPHNQIDRAVRRRQPVGLLVGAGRRVLDVERQRPVRIGLHGGDHRRVDQIAVDRVFDQELGLAVIHGQGPERIHRRLLTGWECQRVVVLAAV